MTFYADVSCSWPSVKNPLSIAVEAPSMSVAVAMLEAWISGFYSGCNESVTLTIDNIVGGKKPRGRTYLSMHDWDQIRTGVHS